MPFSGHRARVFGEQSTTSSKCGRLRRLLHAGAVARRESSRCAATPNHWATATAARTTVMWWTLARSPAHFATATCQTIELRSRTRVSTADCGALVILAVHQLGERQRQRQRQR